MTISQRGFTPIVLLLILILALSGIYLMVKGKAHIPGSKVAPVTVPNSVFQKTLASVCEKTDWFNRLPVSIDQNILKPWKCRAYGGTDNPGSGTILLRGSKDRVVSVKDKYSISSCQDFCGTKGKPFYQKDNIDYIVTMNVLAGLRVGNKIDATRVMVKKTLKLNNGETIDISTSERAILGDDPRLVALLKTVATKVQENRETFWKIDEEQSEQVDKLVAQRFFSDFSKLENPEKGIIEDMTKEINAIQLREGY